MGIEVDDAGAAYPLMIDPLLMGTTDGVIESDLPHATFESLAGAGDVNGDGYDDVILGAPGYDAGGMAGGAAFLFLGGVSGIEDSDVTAADAILYPDRSGVGFGASVAGAGDVNGDGYDDVIVGVPGYDSFDDNGFRFTGAAFVFLGSAAGIEGGVPSAAVTRIVSDQSSGPYTGQASRFGTSVAGVGDVNGDGFDDVVIGAPYQNGGQANPGAVFVFLGSATGITGTDSSMAAAKLVSASPDSWLGWSEAGAGDVDGDGYDDLIVGARLYEWFYRGSYTGSALVFMGSSSGIAAGDTNTAAARLEPDQQWVEFGHGVAGAGDVNNDGYDDVIVGSSRYNNGQGAAFVFLGSASGIADGGPDTAATRIDAGGGVAGAGDVNGDAYDDVIVGGRVFLGGASGVFDGSPATAAASPQPIPGAVYFGEQVAGIGDVNGDGYADMIVGAAFDGGHYYDKGAAFVYLGQAFSDPNGEPELADGRIATDRSGALLGIDVAGAGDVNGDGYDDVIVRASRYDRGNGLGANFVFPGSASGTTNAEELNAAIRIDAGGAATGAGDVNGDGYDDVIVSAGGGVVLVYLGSASGISDGSVGAAATRLASDQTGGFSDESLAAAGDVNGDGYDDVIVGGRSVGPNQTYPGAAYVFLGSASGIADAGPAAAATRLVTDQPFSWFGESVAGAGDVNGDGYGDVVVGAPYAYAGQSLEGAAFVFLGSASGIANADPNTAAGVFESNRRDAEFGASIAGAGDVNGDGNADVIVGAPGFYPGGAAFVFLGEADGDFLGAPNSVDNCTSRTNRSQLDADGFGNPCDADFDQDGVAGVADFGTFRRCYGQLVPSSGGPAADATCVESDMDGDGVVGAADFGLFRSEFGTPPGP